MGLRFFYSDSGVPWYSDNLNLWSNLPDLSPESPAN